MDIITPSGGLLFWMVSIFALVFFLLAKFGFPVITSMIRKRNSHIEKSLEDAREIEKRFAEMEVSCAKMMADTRNEQARMLSQARDSSLRMVDEAKRQADREAQMIIARAREEIQKERTEALKDVGQTVVDLAVTMAEKILREKLASAEERRDLSDRLLEEFKNELH